VTALGYRIALVSEVFFGPGAESRLVDALVAAREQDVELVVLPELALDPWVPCARSAHEHDAESPGGAREHLLRRAANAVGIAVVGGAIVRGDDGVRHNTALFVDADGNVIARYAKTHVPQEPGFWERDHYEDGPIAAMPFAYGQLRFGLQICSDLMRPHGVATLAAHGAHVVLHPRATEPDTWEAWRCVMRAAAMTSGCWVLSVNRPRSEGGTPLGGPSCAVAPDGTIVAEGSEAMLIATVDADAVARASTGYPGYLPLRTEMYAEAWRSAPSKPSGA
jgi:predicted amidohydrolase